MKKKIYVYLSFLLIIFLALGCATGKEEALKKKEEPTTEETFILKNSTHGAASHPIVMASKEHFFDAIEEASGGRIKFDHYAGGSLLEGDEMFEGITSGITDFGNSFFSYEHGRFPILEVLELPGLYYKNNAVAGRVSWEFLKEIEFDPPDVKILTSRALSNACLLSNKPIRSLDDLSGLQIRAVGIAAQAIERLGAAPVAMPMGDVYEALSRGVVDAALAPPEALYSWGLHEVAEYATDIPFLYNMVRYDAVNKKIWNSLPPDLQAIIETKAEESYEIQNLLLDKEDETALKKALESGSIKEIISFSEEDIAKGIRLVEPIQQEFVERVEKEGLPGQECLDLVKKLIEKYNEIY